MNKWVLVTGAAKRIGRAIALELAASGWNIVVHYNHSRADAEQLATEIHAMGRTACLAEIDLAKEKPVAKLIPSLIVEIGPLTALVNNASLFEPDRFDVDGKRHMAINANAPRILSEAFQRQLPLGHRGVILNLLDSGRPKIDFSKYIASKEYLESMTLEMARHYAPHVRVNGIAPGVILPGPRLSPKQFRQLVASAPLQTRIEPIEIAKAARFLIENPALTGEILHVDGGMHLVF
jgi:NAD(P)-dependent dehydrogenase (short-subunit alcohol dehydrogenase family)